MYFLVAMIFAWIGAFALLALTVKSNFNETLLKIIIVISCALIAFFCADAGGHI